MPDPRPKACAQCRKAKVRCDLSTPCARCSKRSLDCQYYIVKRSREPHKLREIQPAINVRHNEATGDSGISKQTSASSGAGSANGHAKFTGVGDYAQTVHDAVSSSIAKAAPTPDMPIPSDFMPDLFELPDSFDLPPFLFELDTPLSASASAGLSADNQLEQRSRSFQQGALTARLLFSKLASYSRMMADAIRLPPFIYPACWSGHAAKCVEASPHRCLPEPLAICSNLTQMFYMRRDGTEGFVWQQIVSHLKQLCNDAC